MSASNSGVREPDGIRALVLIAGLLVLAAAISVLTAWALDIEIVKRVLPRYAPMKPDTAFGLLMGGAALIVHWLGGHTSNQRRGWHSAVSRALALVAALVGLLAGIEYLFGIDIGIDALLFSDSLVPAGPMSQLTAGCLVSFGLAFALPRGRAAALDGLFTALCTLGLLAAYFAVVGYLFKVRWIYQPMPTSMAVHTGVAFALLFLGAMASRPDQGWLKLFLRPGGAGAMVRLIVPTLVVLPALFGWLALQGHLADLYGPRGLTAVLVLVTVCILGAVVWASARRGEALDEALREQELLHATVLENALDAFVMMDDDGRVMEWNSQAEQIFGWPRHDVMGVLLADLIIPADQREAHRLGLAQFLTTGSGPLIGNRQLITALRRNGETLPVELRIVPIYFRERWCFSGFISDISDQKATEDQLRQAQKMDAVGHLTGGIAHDFNNLLTVIIGNLDLLRDRVDGRLREYADAALLSAERGASLVQRLLAFARRQALIPELIDMNELVSNTNELIERTLREDIEVELVLAGDLWPVVADRVQLESALLNLAVNARDAMPTGGKLTIETDNVYLDEDYAAAHQEVSPGDYAMLAVTDTGTGMSQEVLDRAFEPFFTTKGVGEGSGLGLSMIYGFAKQSGGHVTAYSEEGCGATVRLYLPRHPELPGSPLPRDKPSASGSGRRERILVVEDDPSVRGYVVAVLEALNYQVVEANNGAEALEKLDRDPGFDLLFTDVVMPGGMTGPQLAEKVSARKPGIKILYTSGYTQNAIVHHGNLDEGARLLAKPYRKDELALHVRRALDNE